MPVHLSFDLLAAVAALALTWAVWAWRLRDRPLLQTTNGYLTALSLGIVIGSYVLGTANLWLSDLPGVGRSILGALVGGIIAVEGFKSFTGLSGSTGLIFVPTFAALVVVGRIGCAMSGLEDQTYGLPTSLPWGQDFGDGILRHPVAAYESLAMAAFLAVSLLHFARRSPHFMRDGFYLMTGFYALQRFLWEFLKPYAAIIGPLNLFQVACLGLLGYSVVMVLGRSR
jgi:prolipoprotein diacylglyceryltransferase